MKLLKKYPILEPTAFVLIGYVGGILIYEEAYHVITGNAIHIPPWGKFSGILLIMWIALLYSADGSVRRLLKPVIILSMPLMKGFAGLVSLIVWPVKALVSALKPKPEGAVVD